MDIVYLSADIPRWWVRNVITIINKKIVAKVNNLQLLFFYIEISF
jgi:hypothetical protein